MVGAYGWGFSTGTAYEFFRQSGSWSQVTKLIASGGATLSAFGYSVAISGSTAVVGAHFKTSYTGAA